MSMKPCRKKHLFVLQCWKATTEWRHSCIFSTVSGLTKSLAQELGSVGVRVNAVAPGFIDTDMTDELSDSVKASMLATVPMQRLGKPEEVANAVGFLASDLASYITGETLHVNGGMYMG